MAGITLAGFERMRLVDIKTDLETSLRSVFGENIDLQPESRFGQFVGIMSEAFADLWEDQENIYTSFTLAASGRSLEDVMSLIGLTKRSAEYSQGTVQFSGVDGTEIAASTEVSDSVGNTFLTVTPGTIAGGISSVGIIAKETGAITVFANTIINIDTPIFGITAVTNPSILGTIGRDEETDIEIRERHSVSVAVRAQNIASALYSQLLNTEGMVDAIVLENKTENTVDGIPPHTFEAVTLGEASSADIASTIWANTITGINSFGTTSTVHVDSQGFGQTVSWTPSTTTDIWVKAVITTDSSYPATGDDLLKAVIVSDAKELYNIGEDVLYSKFFNSINSITGILTVDLTIGFAASPTGTANLAISARDHAEFDIARVEVA